jgi:4-diphosphocytidyl-2-C-methyl-D-erythritol kinase
MPSWTVTAEAPAKLNLHLEVVGKRSDGYHDLWTVFQAIDLLDTVSVRPGKGPGFRLEVEGPEPAPTGPENLVLRAADALAARLGETRGAEIHLKKRIPPGTGLGGGSSDAAATLLALEALWGRALDPGDRAALALDLGSDVPFFLRGGTALGEGRGERLGPFPAPPRAGYLLVIPDFRIATPDAYRALERRLTAPRTGPRMLKTACERGGFESFVENIGNDLEAGVVRIQPRLARMKQELRSRGAAYAGITGSGSALFAVFRSPTEAMGVLEGGFRIEGARIIPVTPVPFGARVVTRSS